VQCNSAVTLTLLLTDEQARLFEMCITSKIQKTVESPKGK